MRTIGIILDGDDVVWGELLGKETSSIVDADNNTYMEIDSGFSGFHDWLLSNDGNNYLLGSCFTPHDKELIGNIAENEFTKFTNDGLSLQIFMKGFHDVEFINSGDQIFSYNGVFMCNNKARTMIALNSEGVDEDKIAMAGGLTVIGFFVE